MIEGAGGALGHKTVQTVYKAAKARRLLMVEDSGSKLFPMLQFDGDTVRPAIPRILAAAPGAGGWAILQYPVSGDEGRGGCRPLDLIRGDEADIARVVSFDHTLDD